jgi:hypothetical protein
MESKNKTIMADGAKETRKPSVNSYDKKDELGMLKFIVRGPNGNRAIHMLARIVVRDTGCAYSEALKGVISALELDEGVLLASAQQ